MNNRKHIVSIILILTLSVVSFLCSAQPGGGGPPGGGPPVPITGIELLLVAGGALGIKRLMGNKKSKNL